jgi:tRNA A37 N6-isopentenylltransferase MiaA
MYIVYEDAVRTSQTTLRAFTKRQNTFIVRLSQINKYTECAKRRFVIFNLNFTYTGFHRVEAFRVEFVHHPNFSI